MGSFVAAKCFHGAVRCMDMRLRDSRHLVLDMFLKARRIARENFSPQDLRLDGRTLQAALRDAGIDVGEAEGEQLLDRFMDGPALDRDELLAIIDGNVDSFLGEKWSPLDRKITLGRRYAFHELDEVFAKRNDGLELRPLVIELEAGEGVGRLLLSAEKIEEVVQDEREAEKRLSPVITEIEDDSLYASRMTRNLGSVVSVEPVLATADPQPQLLSLCDRLGVEMFDVSAGGLEDRDLEFEVNLFRR